MSRWHVQSGLETLVTVAAGIALQIVAFPVVGLAATPVHLGGPDTLVAFLRGAALRRLNGHARHGEAR
ncbi:hypothetical protein [Defluviimonas salinarum]|uniref:Uncharacterized protein n=1 Tax=Defluviimonas salinarum TaxID=2992147 RepID=A0ABT3JA61_9RHOB|nr:hypothetical protein [Defluviimonas salinarum]MCW3784580.1 hypothetical protein [Defluviimonas salinarum]